MCSPPFTPHISQDPPPRPPSEVQIPPQDPPSPPRAKKNIPEEALLDNDDD